ncbi:hypothetical protein, partial [Vibrio parahaemolyticus]|uniref:hypothetical protein n=1 Tax=Vibrio parahaemolyticus TaxID=670 RepID=UPI001FAE5852
LQPCLLKIYSHMVTFWGNYEGISQRHAVVVMDGAGWHTEEIANDFKMSVSSNFRPILQSQTLSNKYGVG